MSQQSVMTQAFTNAAGFSGESFTLLMLGMIGVLALAWGLIMVLGWLSVYSEQGHPPSYLFYRITFLAFILVMIIILIGSHS